MKNKIYICFFALFLIWSVSLRGAIAWDSSEENKRLEEQEDKIFIGDPKEIDSDELEKKSLDHPTHKIFIGDPKEIDSDELERNDAD